MSFTTALVITFILTYFFIRWNETNRTFFQPIRNDGPLSHLRGKINTPTMGGVLMLIAICCSAFLWNNIYNPYVLISIFVFFSFGIIGLCDDIMKTTKHNSSGVSGNIRILSEFVIGLIAVLLLQYYSTTHNEQILAIPFLRHTFINLGMFYIPFAMLVIVGAGNAVNLTDGLDGLAIVPVMIASATLGIIAAASGSLVLSEHVSVIHIDGVGELAVIASSVIGAGIAFLWFNIHPAKIIMGDVGSLSLGGLLGIIAVMIKEELVFGIIGFLFVIEALSVIIQIMSLKLFKKRVFAMAPIHHHFEKKGWSEEKVVIRFWIFSMICAIIGIAGII
jgi:phospho-N-acetylmuramoyl-pentapeptide-transferase